MNILVPFHNIKIGVRHAVSVESNWPDIFAVNPVCNDIVLYIKSNFKLSAEENNSIPNNIDKCKVQLSP
jgi:hypothetical protein